MAGLIGAGAAIVATLCGYVAYYLLYLAVYDLNTTRRLIEIGTAVLLFLAPITTMVAITYFAFARLSPASSVDLGVSAFVAGAILLVTVALLTFVVSNVNACEFQLSFPLPWYEDACR
jgi:hypothetical protein